MINIVLHEPEMPANTGNIGRSCVITGSKLHLIEPLGFIISDKMVKRSGLDYWERLKYQTYMDVNDFYKNVNDNPDGTKPRIFYATTKAKHRYTDVKFNDGDYIMFGKESAGIPEDILIEHPDDCIRIPMLPNERSLNLSNSVAIVLYEALRQLDFNGMEDTGELHHLHWK